MKYILSETVIISLVTFFILALFQPFGIDQIAQSRILFICGEVLCVFVTVLGVNLAFSKLPSFQIKTHHSIWQMLLRMLLPFICIDLLISALLITYNCWFKYGTIFAESGLNGWVDADGFTLQHFFEMLVQVSIVSVFIIMYSIYRLRNNQLQNKLDEVCALNKLLEDRQNTLAEASDTDEEMPVCEAQKCHIESNTNGLALDVDPRDILYIESMSNYADICYLEQGDTRHFTLRITLKQLRTSLADIPYLVTCHRAFIVNINFIISISTRTSGGYQLQMFGIDKEIPVSRSYTDEIRKRCSK